MGLFTFSCGIGTSSVPPTAVHLPLKGKARPLSHSLRLCQLPWKGSQGCRAYTVTLLPPLSGEVPSEARRRGSVSYGEEDPSSFREDQKRRRQRLIRRRLCCTMVLDGGAPAKEYLHKRLPSSCNCPGAIFICVYRRKSSTRFCGRPKRRPCGGFAEQRTMKQIVMHLIRAP